MDDEARHAAAMRRLEGSAAELELGLKNSATELRLKDSAAQKEQATARDVEAALELSELSVTGDGAGAEPQAESGREGSDGRQAQA